MSHKIVLVEMRLKIKKSKDKKEMQWCTSLFLKVHLDVRVLGLRTAKK